MTTAETPTAEWSFWKKLGFRFVFCYFVLYFTPFPLDSVPFTGKLWALWAKGWEHLTIWTGAHVLHLAKPIVYQPTGSGDTTHDYVLVLISLTIAVAATVIWSVLDRRRASYSKLAAWMRVYLRYALAAIMLGYGFSKVFDLQFSPPGGFLLTETYGQSSPMHLAWVFMGYSIPYTVFAGSLECLAGLLLLFRRTTTAGAGMAAIVMTNVVMMNFCYDIPVKLYSAHLLLTAIVILWPSMGRILDLFLFHRGCTPEKVEAPSWQGWRKWGRWSLKALFIGYVLFSNVHESWTTRKMYAPTSTPSPVQGFYEITALRRGGVEIPRLYTEAKGWRWVSIGTSYLRIGLVDGSRLPTAEFAMDAAKQELALSGTDGTAPKMLVGAMRYAKPDADHLVLTGTLDGTAVEMNLERRRDGEAPLLSRGFHWINELPYNR